MKPFEIAGLPSDEVKNFVAGTHSDPFRVLGPHGVGDDLEIRVFRPDARKIEIVLDRDPEEPIAAQKVQQDGFFCATVSGATRDLPYHLRVTAWDGSEQLLRDPYQYGADHGRGRSAPLRGGKHKKLYEKFGAHLREIGGDRGVYFRGLGAECAARQRGRRFQFLGWPRPSDAQTARQRRLGIFSSRA